MRELLMVAMVLAGCADGVIDPAERVNDERCQRAMRGCLESNERDPGSCTFCAPVGDSCANTFTSFCGAPDDNGWCVEGTCRAICDNVPRCADGETQELVDGADGYPVCVCMPS